MEKSISEWMKFDPLSEAEEITGESYKDNDETMGLGVLLHLSKVKAMNELMEETQDTKFMENFDRYHEIASSIGFNVIFEEEFLSPAYGHETPITETYRVYWRDDGLLLTVESFGPHVNMAKVYYNIKFNEDADMWGVASSGSYANFDLKIWTGDHDAREGLKHKINTLSQNGVFISNWVKRPFLWLLNYQEPKEEGYDYREISEAKIARFPKEVRKAITPEDSST